MSDTDLSLVAEIALIAELKRRYDTLILYADRAVDRTVADALEDDDRGQPHVHRHEMQRSTKGSELAVYGLARVIALDCAADLKRIVASISVFPEDAE